ncbi:hypothetical protein HT594_00101 [Phenacoccus solenopsis nudivirus]|nr:hypothetical protein HT594_00101 [Phenacoccus solenopsis nudivirus]
MSYATNLYSTNNLASRVLLENDDLNTPRVVDAIKKFSNLASKNVVSFWELSEVVEELKKSQTLNMIFMSRGNNETALATLKMFVFQNNRIQKDFYALFVALCKSSVRLDVLDTFNLNNESTILVDVKPQQTVPVKQITFASVSALTRQLVADIQEHTNTYSFNESQLSRDTSFVKFVLTDEIKEQLPRCMVEYNKVLHEGARRLDRTISPYIKYKRGHPSTNTSGGSSSSSVYRN